MIGLGRTLAVTSCALWLAAPDAVAGELHLLGPVPFAYAVDVSDDGQVVTGYDQANVWYWTLDTGVVFVPGALPPANGVGGSVLITADGARVMCSTLQGEPQKTEPTFYTIASGEFDAAVGSLGYHCDISRMSPWDMSPNGRFVCGLAWDSGCAGKGYVWDAQTDTIATLPTLYFYKPTRANGVSNDGSLVAGWNDDYNGYRQGCVWTRNSSGAYVATLLNTGVATVKLREASCVSGNGQWAYGGGRPDVDGGAPYRWSYATGYQAVVPAPAGQGTIQDVNHDGTILLTNFSSGGYVWFADRGYVPLATWADEHGVKLPDEWFLRCFAMTEDALTIVGHAVRGDGTQSPFVLDLRPGSSGCPADLDGDGTVGGTDITALLAAWGPCPGIGCSADFDDNSTIDGVDLGFVLAAWGICQ